MTDTNELDALRVEVAKLTAERDALRELVTEIYDTYRLDESQVMTSKPSWFEFNEWTERLTKGTDDAPSVD